MYRTVMRSWGRILFSHPGAVIRISLVFLLCALPVVSIGWAWGIAIQLALAEIDGRKLNCFAVIKNNFCRQGLVLLFMGLFDLVVLSLMILSVIALLRSDVPLPMRMGSAVFVWIDVLVLLSGIYRYPLAVTGACTFRDIVVRGFILALSQPGQTILIGMVIITVLLICLVSGLFLPLFAPGAVGLLCSFAYLYGEK